MPGQAINTVKTRHVGADWVHPLMGLRILGLTNNKSWGDEVRLRQWRSIGTNYIAVSFGVDTNSLVWSSNWSTATQSIEITANCAWRIHENSNFEHLMHAISINANSVGQIGDKSIHGGNGLIELTAHPAVTGSGSLIIEYRDTDQYLTETIQIEVNESGLVPQVNADPIFFDINCGQQWITTNIEGLIDDQLPFIENAPAWVLDYNVGWHPTLRQVAVMNIFIDQYKILCLPYPSNKVRQGEITIATPNLGSIDIYVNQTFCQYTPNPQPSNKTHIYDADGNAYNYITIGDYQIMLQPLKTTKYTDNSSIPLYGSSNFSRDEHARCYYWDFASYVEVGGMLYNYFVVDEARGKVSGLNIEGLLDSAEYDNNISDSENWHVPTGAEIEEIIHQIDTAKFPPVIDPDAYPDLIHVDSEGQYLVLELGEYIRCPHYLMHPSTGEMYYYCGWPAKLDPIGNNSSGMSFLNQGFISRRGVFYQTGTAFWLYAGGLTFYQTLPAQFSDGEAFAAFGASADKDYGVVVRAGILSMNPRYGYNIRLIRQINVTK